MKIIKELGTLLLAMFFSIHASQKLRMSKKAKRRKFQKNRKLRLNHCGLPIGGIKKI